MEWKEKEFMPNVIETVFPHHRPGKFSTKYLFLNIGTKK